MKAANISALYILILFSINIQAQCILDYSNWGSPVFQDEFNYTNLADINLKWTPTMFGAYNPLNEEIQKYAPDQFSLPGDGTLIINADRRTTPIIYEGRELDYDSGVLTAIYSNAAVCGGANGFSGGLFEIRCKMPDPNDYGMFPAFWLFGNNEEIDIFESTITPGIAGNPSRTFTNNLHYHPSNLECPEGYKKADGLDLSDEFHTYSAAWIPAVDGNPAHVTFFYDGKELRTTTYLAPYVGCPMSLILNLAVNGDFANEDVTHGELIIDYVRVYQRSLADYVLPYKSEEAYASTPIDYTFNNYYNINTDGATIEANGDDTKVFYRGIDNKIQFFSWNNATYSWDHKWILGKNANPDFNIAGDFSVGNNDVVYYRGIDGYLDRYYKVAGVWTHQDVYEGPTLSMRVSIASNSIATLDDNRVVIRTTDNKLLLYTYDGTVWTSAYIDGSPGYNKKVGGDLFKGTANSIYYVGNDQYIHYYEYDGVQWTHFWIESATADAITKISAEPNSLSIKDINKIYYRGLSDNKIHRYTWSGTAYSHSLLVTVPISYEVAGNVKVSADDKIYFLNSENKIKYLDQDGFALWKVKDASNYFLYDPQVIGYFTVAQSDGRIYWRNEDAHLFNTFWEACERLDPPCGISGDKDIYRKGNKGIDSQLIKDEPFRVYPNPASSTISILCSSTIEVANVEIVACTGVVVKSYSSIQIEDVELDISDIPSGIYMVNVSANNYSNSSKLVVAR